MSLPGIAMTANGFAENKQNALDIAEYTLNRYGDAEAFTGWMNDLLASLCA